MKNLSRKRLDHILQACAGLNLGVIGDFFLDAYYDCDPRLDEPSLETGKDCYQVIRTRRQAGAAGTVAANLRALGVGKIAAVGFCGDDGEGYELRRAMAKLKLDMDPFSTWPGRFTPTYGKPCYIDPRQRGKPVLAELERLDIKNRRPTPVALQQRLIGAVDKGIKKWDGLIVLDQVSEPNCGAITTRVRRHLNQIARTRPSKPILVDSRENIGHFRHTLIKPNQREAADALNGGRLSLRASRQQALTLARGTGKTVFLTAGAKGILVAGKDRVERIKAFPLSGPIDPVGAGDTTSAALVAALAAGATALEAATLATLAASVTVKQLGTTGTAAPAQIQRRYQEATRHGL